MVTIKSIHIVVFIVFVALKNVISV